MKHPYWQIRGEGLAHRLVYTWETGVKIPKGYHIHHTCNNKQCLNVEHMQMITAEEHHRIHKQHKFNTKISVPVAQIHPEHGLLKIWPSLREAERNGFDHRNISKAINGRQDTSAGCWWMRIKEIK